MEHIHTLRIEQFQEFAVSKDFYANRLKDHLVHYHQYIEKPHRHAATVVVYFTEGHGVHDIDFTRYEIRPGSLFILYPGQIHSWELSPETDGFIFFHSEWLFDDRLTLAQELRKFRIQQAFLTSLFVPVDRAGKFWSLLESLLQEYWQDEFGKKIYLATIITQLYIEILRTMVRTETESGKTQRTYQERYRTFEDFLEKHFKEIRSVSFYASKLNISPKHLNRIVHFVVGKSASDVILERVVLEAKRMLVNSKKNLNEIATDLGYEDYAYFSHLFRKRTGLSPSQFLKEID